MARTNGFEGGSDETTVTNGNSGGTSGTAFTSPVAGTGATVVYDNAQAHLGTYSCRTATGGTSALAYTNWTWSAKGEDYCRGHFRFTSLPSAQQGILRYLSGGSQSLRVNVKTDGAVEVRNAANSVVGTTTATISAGSWFRVETRVVASTTAGVVELRLYLSPISGTPTETLNLTSLVLTAAVDEVRFGVGAAMSNAVQVWQDAVAADHTTWFGPAVTTGTADRVTTFGTVLAGTRTALGSAARAATFGTAVAGTRSVLAVAARASVFAASAAGTRTVLAAADRQTTFSAGATALRTVPGTASAAVGFSAAASGSAVSATGTPGILATSAPLSSLSATAPQPALAAAGRRSTLTATTSP